MPSNTNHVCSSLTLPDDRHKSGLRFGVYIVAIPYGLLWVGQLNITTSLACAFEATKHTACVVALQFNVMTIIDGIIICFYFVSIVTCTSVYFSTGITTGSVMCWDNICFLCHVL